MLRHQNRNINHSHSFIKSPQHANTVYSDRNGIKNSPSSGTHSSSLAKSQLTSPTTTNQRVMSTTQSHHQGVRRPSDLLYRRTVHPTHIYGQSTPPPVPYEASQPPAQPLMPGQYKPSHIQYISGYQFLPIRDVQDVRKELLAILKQFNALGRIYMNEDGINIQMCVHPSQTQATIDRIKSLRNGLFSSTRIFANDIVDGDEIPPLFDKMSILVRQILNDGLDPQESSQLTQYIETFNHLTPEQWHHEIKRVDEYSKHGGQLPEDPSYRPPVILDIRNLYEYEMGAFKGAIAVDVDTYRETFHVVDNLLGIQHHHETDGHHHHHDHHHHDTDHPHNRESKHQHQQHMTRHQVKPSSIPTKGAKIRTDPHLNPDQQEQCLDIAKKLSQIHGVNSKQQLSNHNSHNNNDNGNNITSTSDVNEDMIAAIPKDTKILAYCTGGIRCLKVGSYLKKHGFTDINVLNGGVNAYTVFINEQKQKLGIHDDAHDDIDMNASASARDDTTPLSSSATQLDPTSSSMKKSKVVKAPHSKQNVLHASEPRTSSDTHQVPSQAATKLAPQDQHTEEVSAHISIDNIKRTRDISALKTAEPIESMFIGSNVVFDHRKAVKVDNQVVSNCHQCDTPSNLQRNCSNEQCDVLFIQCSCCEDIYNGCCSIQCGETKYGTGDLTRQKIKHYNEMIAHEHQHRHQQQQQQHDMHPNHHGHQSLSSPASIHSNKIKLVPLPPPKSRVRPRLFPLSIVQHAEYLH